MLDTAGDYLKANAFSATKTTNASNNVAADFVFGGVSGEEIFMTDGTSIYGSHGEERFHIYVDGMYYVSSIGGEDVIGGGGSFKRKWNMSADEAKSEGSLIHYIFVSTKYFETFKKIENSDGSAKIAISDFSEEQKTSLNENYKSNADMWGYTIEIVDTEGEFVIDKEGRILSEKRSFSYILDSDKVGENVTFTVTEECVYKYDPVTISAPEDADEYELVYDNDAVGIDRVEQMIITAQNLLAEQYSYSTEDITSFNYREKENSSYYISVIGDDMCLNSNYFLQTEDGVLDCFEMFACLDGTLYGFVTSDIDGSIVEWTEQKATVPADRMAEVRSKVFNITGERMIDISAFSSYTLSNRDDAIWTDEIETGYVITMEGLTDIAYNECISALGDVRELSVSAEVIFDEQGRYVSISVNIEYIEPENTDKTLRKIVTEFDYTESEIGTPDNLSDYVDVELDQMI
ncbi:MAG: hypothetical protein E7667_02500 [Ruminococcaceae bacterium]|nr:hypothetical protein [Oscillospiraceae bacterium]